MDFSETMAAIFVHKIHNLIIFLLQFKFSVVVTVILPIYFR